MRKILLPSMLIVCCGLLIGCDDGTSSVVGQQESLEAQMQSVDLETDAIVDEMLNQELNVMPAVASEGGRGVITTDASFSRSRPCPAGGTVAVAGEIQRTLDLDTGVMEATSSGSSTRTDCAFVRHELTITVNGSAEWESFRRRVHGIPDGPQTSSYSGSFHAVRSDGAERSCSFSIEVVREPREHRRTVSGTMCGTEFSRTVTWRHDG